jgi:hypothetical protein
MDVDQQGVTQLENDPFTLEVATPVDLSIWQSRVWREASGPESGLNARGPTAEAVAQTLLRLLESHRLSTSFIPVDGATCEESPLQSFIQRWHTIAMYVAQLKWFCPVG